MSAVSGVCFGNTCQLITPTVPSDDYGATILQTNISVKSDTYPLHILSFYPTHKA